MKRFAALIALTAALLFSAGTASAETYVEVVDAYSTNYYTYQANGHGHVNISICGDGDTDLDLYVYDSCGNLLDYDISYDDRENVCFYGECGQTYTIEVRNLGCVWNQFSLSLY